MVQGVNARSSRVSKYKLGHFNVVGDYVYRKVLALHDGDILFVKGVFIMGSFKGGEDLILGVDRCCLQEVHQLQPLLLSVEDTALKHGWVDLIGVHFVKEVSILRSFSYS